MICSIYGGTGNGAAVQYCTLLSGTEPDHALKTLRTPHRIIFSLMLLGLGAVSLWPALSIDSLFAFIPSIAFVTVVGMLIARLHLGTRLFDQVTEDGFLYTLMGITAFGLVSSALLLICAEAAYIDNTLDGLNLARWSLLAGAPVGAMTWVWISKQLEIKNIILLKSFLISFALFCATITSQVNRNSAEPAMITLAADVMDKEKSEGSIATYLTGRQPSRYIYIPYEEDIERLNISQTLWDGIFKNIGIELGVRKGYFGYLYVTDLNKQPLIKF